MNERDELVDLLEDAVDDAVYFAEAPPSLTGTVARHSADAILAAGYRKPRQVTSVEELDALQIGSVVIDAHGDCFQRVEDADGKGAVVWAGDFMYASSSYLALHATVLHEPEASK